MFMEFKRVERGYEERLGKARGNRGMARGTGACLGGRAEWSGNCPKTMPTLC